jgi:hypothetical protein
MSKPEKSAVSAATPPLDSHAGDALPGDALAGDALPGDVGGRAEEPLLALGKLRQTLNRLQREIRLAIQEQLAEFSGQSLGSIEANRQLARSIQDTLDSHGLRVRCSHCGQPAILRVSPRAGADAGVFVFDHTVDGRRTFHGGRTVLPEIRLVSKPPRKPRSGSSQASAKRAKPASTSKSSGGSKSSNASKSAGSTSKRKRGGRVAG